MLWRANYDNHQVDLPALRRWLGVLTVSIAGIAIAGLVHVVARMVG